MSRDLSLHQLCMLEVSPVELVKIASAAGFNRVCSFIYNKPDSPLTVPLIDTSCAGDFKAALNDTGIRLYNIEVFYIEPDTDIAQYEPYLALGAELGASRATAIINDADKNRAAETVAGFADLAAHYGVQIGVEFMAFSTIRSFVEAMDFVAGINHPNLSVSLDILHLIRNGGSVEDLIRLGVDRIGYVQLDDGPLQMPEDQYWDEAICNRLPPGEGEFPISDIVLLLPEDRCFNIEVPMDRRRDAGIDALARAKILFKAVEQFK